MNRFLVILYLIVFSLYVLFTRQPDYFDGDTEPATIHFVKDSTGTIAPFALYSLDNKDYKIDARYVFRALTAGEKVTVKYDTSKPQHAAVYTFWGYWITWQELLASIALMIVLFQIAKAITNKPTPEGLLSELERHAPPKPRKRKYD